MYEKNLRTFATEISLRGTYFMNSPFPQSKTGVVYPLSKNLIGAPPPKKGPIFLMGGGFFRCNLQLNLTVFYVLFTESVDFKVCLLSDSV